MKLPASSASSAYCSLHIASHQTFSRGRAASAASARGTPAAKRGLLLRVPHLRRRGRRGVAARGLGLGAFAAARRAALVALAPAAARRALVAAVAPAARA